MKRLLLWALIALVPLSTIRVVCVAGLEVDAAALGAAAEAEALECARICTHRPAAEAPAPTPAPTMKCLITLDPGCELLTMQVFLMPQPPTMPVADGVAAIDERTTAGPGFGERRPDGPPPEYLA